MLGWGVGFLQCVGMIQGKECGIQVLVAKQLDPYLQWYMSGKVQLINDKLNMLNPPLEAGSIKKY
jgi:hypothetical protein